MPTEIVEGNAIVASFWGQGDHNPEGVAWIHVPRIVANVCRRATDDPTIDWLDHSAGFLPPKPRRALSIGCGFGTIERMLRERDICQEIEGIDLAEEAIQGARQLAAAAGLKGITYAVADLHRVELPEETYDVIYAHSSIHHIFHLERVFDEVRKALKPNGLFILYEYVGPSQFQYPKAHLEMADALLGMIPEQYRRQIRNLGNKEQAPRVSLAEMNAYDPSEAIRSEEILPLLASRFQVPHLRMIGGTLTLLVLNEIAGNFTPDDPIANALIEGILHIENILIDAGVIPSYHAYIICRKSDEPCPAQTQDVSALMHPFPHAVSPIARTDQAASLAELYRELQSERDQIRREAATQRAFLADREAQLDHMRGEQHQLLTLLSETQQWARQMEQRLIAVRPRRPWRRALKL